MGISKTPHLALAVALAALALGAARAGDGAPASPELVELAVPPPAGGAAGELTVMAGGRELPATDNGPAVRSWRVVVLLDQRLSEPWQLANAAILLAEHATELTALGPVEVVLAGEEIVTTLPATDVAAAVDESLAWVRVRQGASHLQLEQRRDFGRRPQPTAAAAEAALVAEHGELSHHLDRLLSWAADAAGAGPQLLVYAAGGYDPDPAAFYRAALGDQALDGLRPPEPLPPPDELGRALSQLGWTVLAVSPAERGDLLLPEEGDNKPGAERLEQIFEEQRGLGRVAVGVDPRKLGRRQEASDEPELLAEPAAPLVRLAELTGGEMATDRLQLGAATDELVRRRRLSFALPAGLALPVEVAVVAAGAAAEPLRSRRWVGDELPLAVSAARARLLLREELEEGDFWLEAVQSVAADGSSELVLELAPGVDPGGLRVTLVAAGADRPAVRGHLALADAEPLAGEGERLAFRLPVPGAVDPDSPLAVLVEELDGPRRGATFAALRGAAAVTVPTASPVVAGAVRALRLLGPEARMVTGPAEFRALVAAERVGRVEFFLDGELVAERLAEPFSVTVDLGALPRTRRVQAVAYGAGGEPLARDALTVNGGGGRLDVRILRPRRGAGSVERPLVGAVEVEADVRVPEGTRLDRVEFYWRDGLVGTRFAPPFREQVLVPATAPRGFVRVVARLADGTIGEDVVFLNAADGGSERLDVDLVELYVVVSGRDGRPVTGLTERRFEVFEDGRRVEIATFGDAGELPLTVGLAIDSSASMFVKLPRVQRAAADFVNGLERRRDRAFLVSFGRRPQLARTATTDLPQVVRALDRLEPDGQTAIWEAIVYSLVQLQGVPGKKALIVYSDGADEDPDFPFRTCLRFARTVGAPIYVILSNNEIVRTGGRGLSVRGFLGRLRELTGEVGGRVYLTRVGADLDAVYREIAEELRSQYFLGYYSPEGDGESWRRLEVEVEGSGLTARTIAGLFR